MAEYDVIEREGISEDYPVYRATKIEMGNMVSLNATGYAIESTDTASTVFVGVAEKTVDNSSGSDGDLRVPVRKFRLFRFANSAGNPVTTALAGTLCFVEDSEHVCATAGSTNKVIVGIVGGDVTADYAWVYCNGRAQYAEAALIDFAVGQDLTVTRNASVGGTLLVTGVATFSAKSVHSLGITITAGGETITDGNLLVTKGNITSTLGNIVATKGNITATEGDIVDTLGNITATAGNITATKGNIVATEGDVVITKGALTMTAGSATLTKGDITLTDGKITITKGTIVLGLTANDGILLPYAAADGGAGAQPTKASLAAAFGAAGVGRNGWVGAFKNTNGATSHFLVGMLAGDWYVATLAVGL
jgi:hypothetical protein